MEKFKIKIRDVVDIDGKPVVRFDIYQDDICIGESEAEYTVFNGILNAKYQHFYMDRMYNKMTTNITTQ